MSTTLEPSIMPTEKVGGLNLVALAKPYFGLIVLTTALLTVFGVVSMLRMPSGIYPEVAFPRVVVIAQSPGLAVKDVEVAVTRPIEEAVSIVLGVIRVRSKSVRGAAELSIDFAPDTDMIQALNDVRARMAEVGAQLPVGTTSITERQTPSVFPIISFVVTGGRDPSALHDYAYYDLRPRISRIADVSYVTVQGGDIREILVEVDPQSLAAAGLSIADVADRLGKEHRLKAVGRLDREMLQYQVLADTLATDPLDLEDRVIVQKNGQSIRLRDLGRITISHEDRTMAIRSDGRDAVALTVFRRLGGNALAVSSDLEAVLADAAKSAPPGVTIRPVYDQGLLVRTAIANVRDAIVIGGVFSVVILLLFLKSLRATLIASLAIPMSLIISFVFLYLTGDTLNLMSLGGLAVAIGLIIDDTVVVIENIARHLAEGQSGDLAVDRASREISGAVVGSTLTTICLTSGFGKLVHSSLRPYSLSMPMLKHTSYDFQSVGVTTLETGWLCVKRPLLPGCRWGLVPSWTKPGTKPDYFRMVRPLFCPCADANAPPPLPPPPFPRCVVPVSSRCHDPHFATVLGTS